MGIENRGWGRALWVGIAVWSMGADAQAQAFEGGGLEVSRFRAMGGVNVANDGRTPANAALERTKNATILDVHFGIAAADGLDIRDKSEDILDLDLEPASGSDEDLLAYAEQLDQLNAILNNEDVTVRIDTRMDIARIVRPIGDDGSLEFSLYMQSYAWGVGRPPTKLDDDEVYEDADGETYLDIGEDIELVRMQGRSQAGLYVGYGHKLDFKKHRSLAIGGRLRGFGMAETQPVVADAPKRVYGADSVIWDDNPDVYFGGGFAIDLYSSFDLADKLLDARVGVRAESVPSWVKLDGNGRVEKPAIAVGTIVHPFHALNFDAVEFGVDIENITSGDVPIFQLGASYHFGFKRWFYIQPMIGATFGSDGVLPVENGRAFTVGFDSLLGVVMLSAAANLAPNRYDLAFSLGFGF